MVGGGLRFAIVSGISAFKANHRSSFTNPSSRSQSNDEYLKTAGKKHPFLLGKSGAEAWAEVRYLSLRLLAP